LMLDRSISPGSVERLTSVVKAQVTPYAPMPLAFASPPFPLTNDASANTSKGNHEPSIAGAAGGASNATAQNINGPASLLPTLVHNLGNLSKQRPVMMNNNTNGSNNNDNNNGNNNGNGSREGVVNATRNSLPS